MRFRDKGLMLQCIRTTYDSDKGRGVDKLIGSLPGEARFATPELLALLTEDEAKALQNVLFERMLTRQNALRHDALVGLTGTLKQAKSALSDPRNVAEMTPEKVAEMWEALDEMRRSLRAAGLPKPKPVDVNM